MNPAQLTDVVLTSVYTAAELALPMLLTAIAVGLLISVFQAATQINEATLTFFPKIAAIVMVFLLASPWMIRRMREYTENIYAKIPLVTRQME